MFIKSSYSGAGNCVEVWQAPDGMILVRDSKDPSGPALRFTRDEWTAFVQGVQDGEFGPVALAMAAQQTPVHAANFFTRDGGGSMAVHRAEEA